MKAVFLMRTMTKIYEAAKALVLGKSEAVEVKKDFVMPQKTKKRAAMTKEDHYYNARRKKRRKKDRVVRASRKRNRV